jgi:hypothetical protein
MYLLLHTFHYNNLSQLVPKYECFYNKVWWEKIPPLYTHYLTTSANYIPQFKV